MKWGHSPFPSIRGQACWLALSLFAAAMVGAAEPDKLKVALTFDDLPLNGTLPPGVSRVDITRDTLAVLKKHRIPPSYGFINARKLEGDPDGAAALALWAKSGNPLGNHTYSHPSLTRTAAEEFQLDILRNEPVLELLMPEGSALRRRHDWHWFRYPFLNEGDTLEKRRTIRAFLASHGYTIAQTTLDHEDYLWNSAHARCVAKQDQAALQWLRESYLSEAQKWFRVERELSRQVFGRDIHHVALLHLGSFSATILPDLFALLRREGYEFVTLEEAQSDPVYQKDPDIADPRGGTATELFMIAGKHSWPPVEDKPRARLTSICN